MEHEVNGLVLLFLGETPTCRHDACLHLLSAAARGQPSKRSGTVPGAPSPTSTCVRNVQSWPFSIPTMGPVNDLTSYLIILVAVVKSTWRTVSAVFGLLFLTSCVVLMVTVTVKGDQEGATRAAQLIGMILTVAGLSISLIGWWRRGKAIAMAPTPGQLSEAREMLASVVAEQWRREASVRSLGDPEPMPVCWRLGEPTVMDHPRLITEPAHSPSCSSVWPC
jgi:hypothetical protein